MESPTSPDRLFHVSPEVFEPGTVLVPGADQGPGRRSFKHGETTNRFVFASTTWDDAETWARLIGPATGAAAVYVYEVRCPGPVEATGTDECRMDDAVVVRRVAVLAEPAQWVPYRSRWEESETTLLRDPD